MKLLHFILRHTPTEKRLVLVENLNEDSENWAHNDDDDDHRTTVLDDILFSIGVGLDAGIETGGEIGDFLLGLPGKVVGGAVGSVVGQSVARSLKFFLTFSDNLFQAPFRKARSLFLLLRKMMCVNANI